MASNNMDPNLVHQKKMEKKKAVVNELLALRRMKLMQKKGNRGQVNRLHSPATGQLYEAYRVADDPENSYERVTVSREQVRSLIKGTTLENELHNVYGEDAIDDATEHYVNLASSKSIDVVDGRTDSPDSRNTTEMNALQRKLFLHKLYQERKSKLEVNKQKRFVKEQALLQQKKKLYLAKSQLRKLVDTDSTNAFTESDEAPALDSDSSEENLNLLVDEVKQKIGGIERRLKLLKQQRRSEVKSKIVMKKPPAIDYTFKPWQQEQVKIATDIVQDMINKVLDICVSDDGMGSNMLETLLRTDNEQWEYMMTQSIKHDAIVGIMGELIDEVSAVLVQQLAEEIVYLIKMIDVLSIDMIIQSSHSAKHGPKPPKANDPTSKLIDQAYMELKSRHSRTRKGLWGHTQPVISKVIQSTTDVSTEAAVVEPVEETEGDVTTLSYEDTLLRSENLTGPVWERYKDAEFKYWESQSINLSEGPVSLPYRKVIGISCISTSYDNKLIAVGTYRGDILVYDITWQPFRPIRCVSYVGKKADPILQIAWSLDGSRILTLSGGYCLIMWSISFHSSSSSTDIRNLLIPEDKNVNYKCQQLTALVMLEAKFKDFSLKEGVLATSVSSTAFESPVRARFSPILSSTGTQNIITVGFSSGDILQCNFTARITTRYGVLLNREPDDVNSPVVCGQDMISRGNKIAQGIEVELFRFHRFPILLIHFLNNNGDMISLDNKLNIGHWKHEKDQLTGFNWFTPYKKLKLSGTERVMIPKEPERLVFEDEITLKKPIKGRRKRGKQVIDRERKEVMMELRTLQTQNRKPWHSDDQELDDDGKKKKTGKFVTRTYAPRKEEIIDPFGNQTFHIVTKQTSTNLVVKYATRLYGVSGHQHTALIDLQASSDGSKIYFMFLHDKHLPNIKPHITLVDLDLNRMDMFQSNVIKIFMNKEQYERCVNKKEASFAVSRTYLTTRCEYIYCNLTGQMHIFSTKTGSEVAWCAPEKKSTKKAPERGLELSPRLRNLIGKMKLCVLCPDGDETYLILQTLAESGKYEADSGMFTISGETTTEQRQEFSKINQEMFGSSGVDIFYADDENTHREQYAHTEQYTLRDMPPVLYMRITLNSIIDNAVAVATGERMTKEQRSNLWRKDWKNIQDYFKNLEVSITE